MVRLPLLINNQRIKTLEELRANFNIEELLERYRGGQLRAWLYCWDFNSEQVQVESLSPDLSELELAEALCDIFTLENEAREQTLAVIKDKLLKEEQKRLQEEQLKRKLQEEEAQRKAELEKRAKLLKEEQERLQEEQLKRKLQEEEAQRKLLLNKPLDLFKWQTKELKLAGEITNFNRFACFDPSFCGGFTLSPRSYVEEQNTHREKKKIPILCYSYDGYHWQGSESLPTTKIEKADPLHAWKGMGKYFRCNFVASTQEFGVVSEGSAAEISEDGIHWRELEYGIQELVDMEKFLVALFFNTQSPEESLGFHVSLDGILWRKLLTPLPKGKITFFDNTLFIMYGSKAVFGEINVQDVTDAFNKKTLAQSN